MYLVHIHLRPIADDETLPSDVAATMMSAGLGTGLEHVAVHAAIDPHPVIGIYVRAVTLHEAEAVSERIWWWAAGTDRRLCRWVPLLVEVPLLLPEWPA